ncbi:ribosome biogenesis protein Rrp14-C [Histoplasma capsulatum G186AR]|uniref:Ribosome biogenesis protein Rrp14-C n=1 Tax=Ajellomyces capsulatus (strain G186AR / H82 / ATCC MYA-2454 / RMSCC 2432) TaxID=447093 RepID=C0NGG3_AJECG|nr:ribosome biogenesis protein Rrp14-C [Histoplasma capsulatum G186AR]EEH08898.1 ribosome biogenesis protein Rrp14-C [Histoplasma capsulatum G186AR]QSS69381.1 ribosome biogenesis protein Rrp14-C [Histoplasma capsulatum G186AR]
MADSLEERLRSHAQAFDGLLSLIPAKYYYGEDTTDQWQRKKQTKEEARNAKRAKLDPDTLKTAKDVMDENARKRKREEGENDEALSDSDGDDSNGELGTETPMEGLIRGQNKSKKQRKAEKSEGDHNKDKSEDAEARRKRQEEKAAKKAAKKEQKKSKTVAKLEKKKAAKSGTQGDTKENMNEDTLKHQKQQKLQEPTLNGTPKIDDDDEVDEDIAPIEGFSALQNTEDAEPASTAPSSPGPNSQQFDPSNPPSGTSSISSIAPPVVTTDATTKPETVTQSSNDINKKTKSLTPEELKQRLQKRIEELRAARHADGFNGKPARNRQELIEARRQREEQRKAHKKELRQKAREEEQRKRDEAIARRFSPRGSGSLLASPRSPADSISSIPTNLSFGRVVFADGQQADPSLSTLINAKKRKGPQDAQTALKALEAKQSRLEGLDETKRAEIEEKDMWLNAKKRAHGERVKDDISLLRKTLNRKTGAKKKSEKQWKERIEGVIKGKEMRQKKREENLRKRREEKGAKGAKKKGGGKKTTGAKKRPGFEGGFKAKKK